MSSVKFKRLPNGYGKIQHLKGRKLRNPFFAYKTCGKDPSGKPIHKSIGSFRTYSDAFAALVNYHEIAELPESDITFADLYRRFREEYLILPSKGKVLSASSLDGYKYAFAAVSALHDRRFVEITAPDLQKALEDAGGSASKQQKIKVLYSKLYQFADYLGMSTRNLSEFVRITKVDDPERNPFTPDEIRQIWRMPRSKWRDCTLVMIYTGMRVGELFTVHDITAVSFVAGLKTEAGIDRLIPIHPDIASLIHGMFPVSGSPNLLQHWFARNLPDHTPQDCRRTFVTFADECGISPTA